MVPHAWGTCWRHPGICRDVLGAACGPDGLRSWNENDRLVDDLRVADSVTTRAPSSWVHAPTVGRTLAEVVMASTASLDALPVRPMTVKRSLAALWPALTVTSRKVEKVTVMVLGTRTDGVDWQMREKTMPWTLSGTAWVSLAGLTMVKRVIGSGPTTVTLMAGDAW